MNYLLSVSWNGSVGAGNEIKVRFWYHWSGIQSLANSFYKNFKYFDFQHVWLMCLILVNVVQFQHHLLVLKLLSVCFSSGPAASMWQTLFWIFFGVNMACDHIDSCKHVLWPRVHIIILNQPTIPRSIWSRHWPCVMFWTYSLKTYSWQSPADRQGPFT